MKHRILTTVFVWKKCKALEADDGVIVNSIDLKATLPFLGLFASAFV